MSLCTAAFDSLRPEKGPQVCINSSGKPVIQPPQDQQQRQEKCSLPPPEQDDAICTALVGEGSLNEVHHDQTSKLQEALEEKKTETLSSKDEHLQKWALYGVNHAACTPPCALFRIDCALPAVFSVQTKILYVSNNLFRNKQNSCVMLFHLKYWNES